MSDIPKYIRCRNCERLVAENDTFGKWYCSKDCAMRFTQCPVCGNFFEAGKGAGDFCSPNCAELSTDNSDNSNTDQYKEIT